MSPSGDMTFGKSGANFLVDSPAAVGQRVLTRLRMWQGDWFLNPQDGTPYAQQILGHNNIGLASALLQSRVLDTPFVSPPIVGWTVNYDAATRGFSVKGTLNTQFGATPVGFPTSSSATQPFGLGSTPLGGGPLGA